MSLELLKELSSGPTPDRRLELLRKVTDLYLSNPHDPSEMEEALFSDILDRVLDTIGPALKPEFAEQLADAARTPEKIARKLAWDEDFEVAGPVLSRSPALTHQDLLDIASRASDKRLQAVASRPSVPSTVTDVLIERGSRDVLHTVARNQGAEISTGGMARMAARGKDDIGLLESIFKRRDLSPDSVVALKSVVSEDFARLLAARGIDVEQGISAKDLDKANSRFKEEMQRRRAEVSGVERLLEAVQKGELTMDQAIGAVLEKPRLLDVAALMAPLLGLTRNFVFHTLATGEPDQIAVLLRALDISYTRYAAVIAVIAVRRKKARGAEAGAKDCAPLAPDDYDRIEVAVAQRSMRFLKVRMTTA
jgi:uncharacterized protein (DUF2336 family)